MKKHQAASSTKVRCGRGAGERETRRRPWPFLAILVAAGLPMLSGCRPEEPAGASTTPTEAFEAPAPQDANDDIRIVEAGSSSDAISQSLALIHDRFKRLKEANEGRAEVGGDLRGVIRGMGPLIRSARLDCDAIKLAAEDLAAQLPIAQEGYRDAAKSYRRRAEGFRDPDMKRIETQVAEQFDWLVQDTPRRIQLTQKFLRELEETKQFLAEADRCLKDTSAAIAVLSNGSPPRISADSRAFGHRLGQLIDAVYQYLNTLIRPPPTPAAPRSDARVSDAMSESEEKPRSSIVRTAAKGRIKPSPSITEVWSTAGTPYLRKATWKPEAPIRPAVMTPARPDPLAVDSVFAGELANSAAGFACTVYFMVEARSGKELRAVLQLGGWDAPYGRRGLRGRLSDDGRRLVLWAEWWEGYISPEQVRYDLTIGDGGASGPWRTSSMSGWIRLRPAEVVVPR